MSNNEESTEILEPGVALDGTGLHVSSQRIAEKLEKKKLSPSLITGLESCAASWFANSFVIRDIIEEEPDNPARRGSMFHKVMEDLFKLPAEERTTSMVKSIVGEVSTVGEFADLGQNPDAMQWLRDAINGYYSMGGKPQGIQIANITNTYGKEVPGLEVFVQGNIGSADRKILGFIDRVINNTNKPGTVVVEDYKSGKKAKKYNPNTKSTDGLGEARQQVIYTMLLEQMGIRVSGARLLFPVPQQVVNIPVHDKAFREKVVSDVEQADQKLTIMTERNTFEFSPNFLCSWCPLVKACPVAKAGRSDKARDAVASQPNLDVLAKGFEFSGGIL